MNKLLEKHLLLCISVILVLLTLIVYARTLGHDFVNFDDPRYVYENPPVKAGLTWAGVHWAFVTGHESNWHPLTWMSHMLDCQIYGVPKHPDSLSDGDEHRPPWGHHLTNLLLHMASTILLFLLLFRMTGFAWRSAFVAALFAVHPQHVESVAWLAERKDVLSAFFWIVTMHAYVSYCKRPAAGRYMLVILSFALGLMSKPMLVSLPLILLMMDYWPMRRFGSVPSWKLIVEKLPLLAMTAVSSVITFLVQQGGGAVGRTEVFPIGVRAANACVSCVTYITKMIWPSNLSIYYVHPGHTLPTWQVIGAAAILIAVTTAAIQMRKSRPYVLAGWLWFIVTLIPVIGLVQVGSQARADRYTYIPLVGLFILITWLVSEPFVTRAPAPVASKKGKKRIEPIATARPNTGLVLAACVVVLIFTICGFVQAGYWKNSETLWTHTIDATGRNPLAEKMLGEYFEKEGKLDDAMEHYQNAVDIKPTFIEARNNLGALLARQGRTDEAIQTYEEALKYAPPYSGAGRPNTAIVENNLAHQLVNAKRYGEAIAHYQAALRMLPKSPSIHCDYGVALAYSGKPGEALRELKESLRIAPKRAATYASLGLVYAMMNQQDTTIRESQQAVHLDPSCKEAYNNMAVAYAIKGDFAQAWKQLHLFEEHGGKLNQRFVEMLSSQMAEPGR